MVELNPNSLCEEHPACRDMQLYFNTAVYFISMVSQNRKMSVFSSVVSEVVPYISIPIKTHPYSNYK